MWRAQHVGLADCAKVISFDRRGFGRASAPPALSREPDDLLAILDAIGTNRAWLLGQSQGARPALAFALAYPSRVAGLFLQGMPGLDGVATSASAEIPLEELRHLADTDQLPELRRCWLEHPLMQTRSPRIQANLANMLADYISKDLLTNDVGLNLRLADLERLRCPVLFVTGEHETPMRCAAVMEVEEVIPAAQVLMIGDAGHLCNLEHAAAFSNAIKASLSRYHST